MTKFAALPAGLQTAIAARAELLRALIVEAELSGVSPEVVDQHLADELADLETQLSAIYPPERVEAIVNELLKAYDTMP